MENISHVPLMALAALVVIAAVVVIYRSCMMDENDVKDLWPVMHKTTTHVDLASARTQDAEPDLVLAGDDRPPRKYRRVFAH